MQSLAMPVVQGLSDSDADLLRTLFTKVSRKRRRNVTRRSYYEHQQGLKDLGIAIPPHLTDVETVVGWPAKAVDAMARRVRLERFVRSDGGSTADLGLDAILKANDMSAVMPQAHTSTLMHSCAFGFVTAGDTDAGEPETLITVRSAEWATGIYGTRSRGLTSALSILDVDKSGRVDAMAMYTPGRVVIMRREGRRWDLRQVEHDLGMPVRMLAYRAQLDRPFGSSRISRPIMALTDSAVRTLLRTEVSAEFFNAPRAYALGADENAFVDSDGNPLSGWQVMLGRLLALSRDENGDLPQVGQFAQQSMEPNIAHLRMLAQQFASESSLPLRSVGIVGDNPESAEAIREANEELALEINHWEDSALGPAWIDLATTALRTVDDTPAARAIYATLGAQWANQESATRAARADSFAKITPNIPGLAESEVGMEMAGMTRPEIERFQAEQRSVRGRQLLDAALATAPAGA